MQDVQYTQRNRKARATYTLALVVLHTISQHSAFFLNVSFLRLFICSHTVFVNRSYVNRIAMVVILHLNITSDSMYYTISLGMMLITLFFSTLFVHYRHYRQLLNTFFFRLLHFFPLFDSAYLFFIFY